MDRCRPARPASVSRLIVGLAIIVGSALAVRAEPGLRGEFYRDTPESYGAFGSDTSYPQPYWRGVSPTIDFVYADNVDQYFSARWQGYLYVPAVQAGAIVFKVVTDDGARLYLDDNLVIDWWRLQSHQTIGTESDECTHEATVTLSAGYHPIKLEYFEWDGGEHDPDPCRLYWDGAIIPSTNLCTEIPPSSALAITDVSAAPSPFNPSGEQTTTISYTLSLAATVTLELFDTDGTLVRTLVDGASRGAGEHEETWDGRDDDQQVVADGAYRYVITAVSGGDTVVYDPGCPAMPEIDDFAIGNDAVTNPIAYTLDCDCLVRIRIGTVYMGGYVLRTLLDWEYRPTGLNESDAWDGKDQSGNYVAPDLYQGAIWVLPVPTNAIIVDGGS